MAGGIDQRDAELGEAGPLRIGDDRDVHRQLVLSVDHALRACAQRRIIDIGLGGTALRPPDEAQIALAAGFALDDDARGRISGTHHVALGRKGYVRSAIHDRSGARRRGRLRCRCGGRGRSHECVRGWRLLSRCARRWR